MTGIELQTVAAERIKATLKKDDSFWDAYFPWCGNIYLDGDKNPNCLCLVGDGIPMAKFFRRKNGSWMLGKVQSARLINRANARTGAGWKVPKSKDHLVNCRPEVFQGIFGKSAEEMMGHSVSPNKIVELMVAIVGGGWR